MTTHVGQSASVAGVVEPMVGMVTFEQYAFVTAGVADGIKLADLLEYQEIDPASWEMADEGFLDLLLDDVDAGALLTLRLGDLQLEARQLWRRSMPPLDTDLRAWLDFQRGLGLEEKPHERLRALGIGVGELGLLHREWSERLEKDTALRAEAAEILKDAPGPVEVAVLAAPKLRPRDRPAGTGTGFFRALKFDEIMPFDADAPAVADAIASPRPPLISPLPIPPPQAAPEPDLDGTGELRLDMLGTRDVPFMPMESDAVGEEIAEDAEDAGASPVPHPSHEECGEIRPPDSVVVSGVDVKAYGDTEPEGPPARSAGALVDETSIGIVRNLGPELPFVPGEASPPPPATAPDPHLEVGATGELSRARILSGLASLPFAPKRSEVDETMIAVRRFDLRPLPFEPAGGAPPPPRATEDLLPHPAQGETAPLERSALMRAPVNPAAMSAMDTTAIGALAPVRDETLPFARSAGRAEAAVPGPVGYATSEPAEESGPFMAETEELSPALLALAARRASLPFAPPASTVPPAPEQVRGHPPSPGTAQAAEPLAGPGSLTLEQYAAVETEIACGTPAASVLAAYRISARERLRLGNVLRALVKHSPVVKDRWLGATEAYREWRRLQKKK